MTDAQVVLNYLEWHKAIQGGAATTAAHRRLVAEDRPKPTLDEALSAARRLSLDDRTGT